MTKQIETTTPVGVMTPIGPYSHLARYGDLVMIGGIAGVDPASNELVGPDIGSQTQQIMDSFEHILRSVGSDFRHVMHINVFLADIGDFEAMNRAYEERIGDCRPARTAIGVTGLPKPGALVTMNLTAIAAKRTDEGPHHRRV